jgi:hypothetical protein
MSCLPSSSFSIWLIISTSMWLVGSSNTNKSGSPNRAEARANLRLWPPLKLPTYTQSSVACIQPTNQLGFRGLRVLLNPRRTLRQAGAIHPVQLLAKGLNLIPKSSPNLASRGLLIQPTLLTACIGKLTANLLANSAENTLSLLSELSLVLYYARLFTRVPIFLYPSWAAAYLQPSNLMCTEHLYVATLWGLHTTSPLNPYPYPLEITLPPTQQPFLTFPHPLVK